MLHNDGHGVLPDHVIVALLEAGREGPGRSIPGEEEFEGLGRGPRGVVVAHRVSTSDSPTGKGDTFLVECRARIYVTVTGDRQRNGAGTHALICRGLLFDR